MVVGGVVAYVLIEVVDADNQRAASGHTGVRKRQSNPQRPDPWQAVTSPRRHSEKESDEEVIYNCFYVAQCIAAPSARRPP